MSVCSKSNCMFRTTVVRQTNFDVITIGQCVVSNGNLVCSFLIKHKTLSDGEVSVCLLQKQLYVSYHCRTTVPRTLDRDVLQERNNFACLV